MRAVGRFLQASALVVLLVGLFFGLEGGPHAMARELGLLAAGVILFLAGLGLQRRAD